MLMLRIVGVDGAGVRAITASGLIRARGAATAIIRFDEESASALARVITVAVCMANLSRATATDPSMVDTVAIVTNRAVL